MVALRRLDGRMASSAASNTLRLWETGIGAYRLLMSLLRFGYVPGILNAYGASVSRQLLNMENTSGRANFGCSLLHPFHRLAPSWRGSCPN